MASRHGCVPACLEGRKQNEKLKRKEKARSWPRAVHLCVTIHHPASLVRISLYTLHLSCFFFFLYIYTSYFYDQLRPVIFNRKCHHSTSLYRRFKSCRKFLECRNLPVCRQTGPRGGIVRISTAIIFWRNNPRVESPEREKDNNNGSFIK